MKLDINLREGEEAKDIRKAGDVPAVIYGKHLQAPIHVKCKKNDFIKRFKEAGYSTPLTLEGAGINQFVLIQDIQVDPVSDILTHIDFLAVKMDEKVSAEVPLKMTGESPIEKTGEGRIQLLRDFIEVEAFPQDLPHDIMIDISVIEGMGDTIFIKDLKISDKVKVLDDPEQALVTVLRLAEEEAEVASAAAEGATGAEGEKKEGDAKDGEKPAAGKKEEKKDEKK